MKTKLLMLSALAALTLAACQKDNDGGLLLKVEDMTDGAKMAVSGNVAYWAAGDRVRVNNELVTVSINESAGTATAVSSGEGFQAPYFGVYPAAIYASNSGDSYTLNLPSSYTYATTSHFGSTMQNLGTPMVAYSASGSELLFKHITAALNVKVINDFGVDIRVTGITISSNKYQLSGATTLTVGSDINVDPVSAEGDGNAALRQVQMTFGGTQLIVPCGGSAVVQVPVLPVGDDNRFTISVTVQNKDDADMSWTFSKTQAGNSSDGYALGRAMVGYAPAKFGGVFSVAADKQVRFAPGNLQYQASTNTWRFAKHQYDYIGNAAGNTTSVDDRETQSAWIDLFGWGTSGWDNGNAKYQPWCANMTSYSSIEYGPKLGETFYDLSGDYANSDWGIYNSISNGGAVAGRWHTLTNVEWSYLTSYSRGASNVVNGTSRAKYTYATVGTTHGIIFFPDVFDVPTFTGNSSWGTINSSSAWTTTIELVDWNLLEVAGCIFLPAAGGRSATTGQNPLYSNENSYGNYWCSVQYSNSNAYYMRFYSSNGFNAKDAAKYQGYSVRLVRDVN